MSNRFAPRTDWARHPRDRKPDTLGGLSLQMLHAQHLADVSKFLSAHNDQSLVHSAYVGAIFPYGRIRIR